jgi:hypothetical protein
MSKGDTVTCKSKRNECSFVYNEITATDQTPLMGSVNVGLQDFAVIHISNPTEDY